MGFGYFVSTKDCTVISQNGKLMRNLPNQYPTPVSQTVALQFALRALKHRGPAPWVAEPNRYHVPVGNLVLQPRVTFPTPHDISLAWAFNLHGAGLPAMAVTVDASTGEMLAFQSPWVE